MRYLIAAIYNTILAIIGLSMGILFIGIPCLVFMFLAGIWTCIAILNYKRYVNIRRTKVTSGE